MGAVVLLVSYLLLAVAFGVAGRKFAGVPSRAALVLSLVPLAFTASGFLPRTTLASTVSLAGVSPWANPVLVEELETGSTPGNPQLFDSLTQFEPWRVAARNDLFLDPGQGSGAALLGNGISAVLFPLEIFSRALPPSRATTLVQMGRLLIAVWGAFLLTRLMGAGEVGSLVGAAAFAGSGILQLWRTSPIATAVAIVPWMVWALVRLVRRPSAPAAGLLGLVGALSVYAGHLETTLHGLVLATLVSIPFWTRSGRRLVVAWGVVAAVLAGLLAGPALLPFLENLFVSAEWQQREGISLALEASAAEAGRRLVPAIGLPALGPLLDGARWTGPEGPAEMGGPSLAAPALLLALLSLRRGRGEGRWRWWFGIGLLGLLVSARVPYLPRLFEFIPLFEATLLKRLSLWWAVVVSMLAGRGATILLRDRDLAGGLALVSLGLGLATGASAWVDPRLAPLLPWASVPLVALAAAAAIVWRAGRRTAGASGSGHATGTNGSPDRVATVLVAAVLVPQTWLFGSWVPRSASVSYYPETEAVRWVRAG